MLRGSIPPTGLPLPRQNSRLGTCDLLHANTSTYSSVFPLPTNFILAICGGPSNSAGSTSLLVFMSAIGIVLNVDRQSRKQSMSF